VDSYIVKNGKKLRYGFTTGACAAAASKAATYMLFHRFIIPEVEIETPKGWELNLEILDAKIADDWSMCGVKKDGGDDPDVTSGLIVYSKVEKISGEDIVVDVGEGIGRVTRKGLQIKPGEPAINPVPLSMIYKEVGKVKPPREGVRITLSIPGGEEAARGTFNPKLGIVGGLSILGTSGIVEPMSTEALKKTLEIELSMLAAEGHRKVILVPGNYGKRYAISRGRNDKIIISYGNFLGFMLEKVVEYGFQQLELIGDLGKLIKVSAGIFNTAGRVADARGEIMAAYAAFFGAPREVVAKILFCGTTEEALEIMEKSDVDLPQFYAFVARRIVEKCRWYAGEKLHIQVGVFSQSRGFLAGAGKEKKPSGVDVTW
jgi:cobalt-precorrin-5B (C1)-methyltransferase